MSYFLNLKHIFFEETESEKRKRLYKEFCKEIQSSFDKKLIEFKAKFKQPFRERQKKCKVDVKGYNHDPVLKPKIQIKETGSKLSRFDNLIKTLETCRNIAAEFGKLDLNEFDCIEVFQKICDIIARIIDMASSESKTGMVFSGIGVMGKGLNTIYLMKQVGGINVFSTASFLINMFFGSPIPKDKEDDMKKNWYGKTLIWLFSSKVNRKPLEFFFTNDIKDEMDEFVFKAVKECFHDKVSQEKLIELFSDKLMSSATLVLGTYLFIELVDDCIGSSIEEVFREIGPEEAKGSESGKVAKKNLLLDKYHNQQKKDLMIVLNKRHIIFLAPKQRKFFIVNGELTENEMGFLMPRNNGKLCAYAYKQVFSLQHGKPEGIFEYLTTNLVKVYNQLQKAGKEFVSKQCVNHDEVIKVIGNQLWQDISTEFKSARYAVRIMMRAEEYYKNVFLNKNSVEIYVKHLLFHSTFNLYEKLNAETAKVLNYLICKLNQDDQNDDEEVKISTKNTIKEVQNILRNKLNQDSPLNDYIMELYKQKIKSFIFKYQGKNKVRGFFDDIIYKQSILSFVNCLSKLTTIQGYTLIKFVIDILVSSELYDKSNTYQEKNKKNLFYKFVKLNGENIGNKKILDVSTAKVKDFALVLTGIFLSILRFPVEQKLMEYKNRSKQTPGQNATGFSDESYNESDDEENKKTLNFNFKSK